MDEKKPDETPHMFKSNSVVAQKWDDDHWLINGVGFVRESIAPPLSEEEAVKRAEECAAKTFARFHEYGCLGNYYVVVEKSPGIHIHHYTLTKQEAEDYKSGNPKAISINEIDNRTHQFITEPVIRMMGEIYMQCYRDMVGK